MFKTKTKLAQIQWSLQTPPSTIMYPLHNDKPGLRGAYHQTALSAEGTRCDTVDSDLTHCGNRTS